MPHQEHRTLVGDFVAAIAQGREPLASAAEALESQRLIQAMLVPGRP